MLPGGCSNPGAAVWDVCGPHRPCSPVWGQDEDPLSHHFSAFPTLSGQTSARVTHEGPHLLPKAREDFPQQASSGLTLAGAAAPELGAARYSWKAAPVASSSLQRHVSEGKGASSRTSGAMLDKSGRHQALAPRRPVVCAYTLSSSPREEILLAPIVQ